jgi:hypothetical protein
MGRLGSWAALGALVSSAFAGAACAPPPAHTAVAVEPTRVIGRTHLPYKGKPAYLASARPLLPTAPPEGSQCRARTPACDQRLRAALAALDGQTLALSSPPSDLELRALQLTLRDLGPLLVPYPDMGAEYQELSTLVAQLSEQTLAQQAASKKRLIELLDLIRVQLAAAQ